MLDAAAALLSMGKATHQIPTDPLRETGLSQVFLAINPAAVSAGSDDDAIDKVVDSLHACKGTEGRVRYPGERTLQLREENRRLGLPVDETVWAEIEALTV